jgi:flagellar basal-body rod protein FlgC
MKIVIIHEEHKNFLNNIILYKNYNVKIIDKDGYWVIENINEEILLDVLLIINLKLDIIMDNIANVNTTRTVSGGPFIRKYLEITAENGIEILKDTFYYTRFVWDPSHPDAILIGEKEGYVEYPNVDIVSETVDQIAYTNLKNVITEYLKVKYNVYIL